MSKNIFNVLATHDDSDDERRPHPNTQGRPQQSRPVNNQTAPKDTKKEARAKDTQLREKYGDRVDKDTRPNKPDGPKPKDDYNSGDRRPYDRHSGTGKPAFKKNDYKKEGHGRGNVGSLENPVKQDGEGVNHVNEDLAAEGNVNIVQLPEEEIVTLDDYVNNTGITFGIKGGQQVKNKDPKAFEDANTKAIVSKRTQQQDDAKKSSKQVEKKQNTKNVVEVDLSNDGQRRRDNRQGNNKQGYVKYDKNEFPSLD